MPEKPQHRSKLMANTDRMTMFVINVTSAVRSARMNGAASSKRNVTTSTIGSTRKRSLLLPRTFRACAAALVVGTSIDQNLVSTPADQPCRLCRSRRTGSCRLRFCTPRCTCSCMIVPGHHRGSAARAFLEDRMIERGRDLLAAEFSAGGLDRFLVEFHP